MRPTALELLIRSIGKQHFMANGSVRDFFTRSSIYGVHVYTSRVDWQWTKFTSDCLTPDRLMTFYSQPPEKRRPYIARVSTTVGRHCFHASPRQGFRFGYHRFLKRQVLQLRQTLDNFRQHSDNAVLRAACLGMLAARACPEIEVVSYGVRMDLLFEQWCSKGIAHDPKQLIRQTRAALR